ncbi:hypothetical protein CABS02_13969 [Colletotrichum abscissum]|uniref:Uncharacterized protein n=1 Tax=Colletotrichum abscissum TaxID=1671311 RepID=A0A9Q0ATY2_9PEZI|nr:hypothetical protein CABS02_13969 [Colletotrichum abscissum]
MSNIPPLDSDPVNANMQPAHGTLVHDGRSLDGQEYQRGDPVAIVENGTEEDLTDAIYILNFRTNRYMLVPLKAVCWFPTHTEQRSGTNLLLTLYGYSLDFRRHALERPQMGYRGIATLFGSCVYVGREVMLEGNASRVNLEPANRASLFTAQWNSLSFSEDVQQPALTPSASSCASSRSPSESGDDVSPPWFHHVQVRRDSAIEIRDPGSPIYESCKGLMSASPKPFHIPTLSFATKPNTRIAAEAPKARPHGSNTWSNLESGDEYSAFADNLEHGTGEHHMNGMMTDVDLQVNYAFMPQNKTSNYVPEQHDQQRPGVNAQEPLWATQGLDTDNGNAWDNLQMPPQHAPDMRQPQLPMRQRQQALSLRAVNHADYYEQYRLAEEQGSSHNQNGPVGPHPQQPEAVHMQNDPHTGYSSPQIPPSNPSQSLQDFQMTPIMDYRVPAQPVHAFTPSEIIDSFRQSTQAHIRSLESHCEQLQQSQASDVQLRQENESLQAARRNNEESLQLLRLLQPITGIPLKGTEKRLQSIADQIVDAMKNLLPNGIERSDKSIEQLDQKVQSLREFIEYVGGVHPEVVKRAQDPAAVSTDKGHSVPVTTTNQVPSAPASVSSHTADKSDSRRLVDGQATPPSDRSAAMALYQDRSRILRDMTAADSRRPEPRINTAPEYYAPNSYRQPSSRTHSPLATHSAPAEPPDAAGHGFFQRRPPTHIQQTMPITDFAAPMQDETTHAYPSPTSVEMMRPMQPVSSLLPQPYTMQQESNFYLQRPPPNFLYPATGAEMAQSANSRQSPVGYQPAPGPAESNYYQNKRSGLPDRRTVRQERPAPYSLNYRDQRRRRGSQ